MKIYRVLIINIILMITIVSAQNTFAVEHQKPLHVDLSKTLGFIMGQRFSLNRIEVEYSGLSLQAKKVALEFDTTFSVAEKNIEKALKGILKDLYSEYITMLKKQIETTLKSQQISQDTAVQFLDEVELRAKGEIPSPILETLLTYQYIDRPLEEFNQKFTKTYRTKGHLKAKGLDLQIEYPESWSSREGKRPNVIQFFRSNNGRGSAAVSIMTRDFEKEAQDELALTHEEIQALKTLEGNKELASEVFSEKNLREIANGMGMTNVKNIKTKRIILDRWPGVVLEFTGEQQRLDITMMMYNRIYIAIYKKHMIFLQFGIGKLPGETDDSLKTKVSQFVPLFRLIANSLVIQNQY